jgi:hypothetical protein
MVIEDSLEGGSFDLIIDDGGAKSYSNFIHN